MADHETHIGTGEQGVHAMRFGCRGFATAAGAGAVASALLPSPAFGWGTPGKSNNEETKSSGGRDGSGLVSELRFSGSAVSTELGGRGNVTLP